MNFRTHIAPLCILFTILSAHAQNRAATPPPPTPPIIFNTSSTLVLVPALVHDKFGAMVYLLKAGDFTLTDNGLPQKLSLENDTDTQPLALVVAIENGGAATLDTHCDGPVEDTCPDPGQLTNFLNVGPFLESLVGGVRHRVAVVTFDSSPRLQQNFTDKMDKISNAMQSVPIGDNGDAILDTLNYAVDLLRTQPPEFRRAILLISETVDRSSHIKLDVALRAISDTNTVIYSLAYSTGRADADHYAYENVPTQCKKPNFSVTGISFVCINPNTQNPGGCMGNNPNAPPPATPNQAIKQKAVQAYDCLGQLVPPIAALKMAVIESLESMRHNTPETVAHLTGGEYYKVENIAGITRSLTTIANHVPNRYVLSFTPSAPTPGPHNIELHLKNYPNLTINARTGYWIDDTPAPTAPAKK